MAIGKALMHIRNLKDEEIRDEDAWNVARQRWASAYHEYVQLAYERVIRRGVLFGKTCCATPTMPADLRRGASRPPSLTHARCTLADSRSVRALRHGPRECRDSSERSQEQRA